jgi:carbon-monoxide dehydrogenase iron sulfur subunit
MKRVYALEERCLDCKLCEVACKTAHSKTKDVYKAWRWEDPEPQSRIHVDGDKFDSIAVQCRHCDDPDCVASCITGALTKNPLTGVVTVDENRCIGCMTCMASCPYGVPRVTSGVSLKCDLCTEGGTQDADPACVRACPNRALVFIESEVKGQ